MAQSAKVWRGEKKYSHVKDLEIELLKLERLLDSLHQKNRGNKQISKCLGISRSLLGRLGWTQKSLKRWQQIRPNKTKMGE